MNEIVDLIERLGADLIAIAVLVWLVRLLATKVIEKLDQQNTIMSDMLSLLKGLAASDKDVKHGLEELQDDIKREQQE